MRNRLQEEKQWMKTTMSIHNISNHKLLTEAKVLTFGGFLDFLALDK